MESIDQIRQINFLVVDDYESMRMLVQEELESLGITNITFATSGNDAFSILDKLKGTSSEIHFVITDMMMENGTGIELTQNLRNSEKFKNLPVLMISSMSEASFILNCIKAGIDDYIVKPWETDDLIKKLNQISLKRIKFR